MARESARGAQEELGEAHRLFTTDVTPEGSVEQYEAYVRNRRAIVADLEAALAQARRVEALATQQIRVAEAAVRAASAFDPLPASTPTNPGIDLDPQPLEPVRSTITAADLTTMSTPPRAAAAAATEEQVRAEAEVERVMRQRDQFTELELAERLAELRGRIAREGGGGGGEPPSGGERGGGAALVERPGTHGSEAFGPFLVGYTLFSAGRESWHGDFGTAALNLATLIEPVGVVVALGQARQSWRTGHGARAVAEASRRPRRSSPRSVPSWRSAWSSIRRWNGRPARPRPRRCCVRWRVRAFGSTPGAVDSSSCLEGRPRADPISQRPHRWPKDGSAFCLPQRRARLYRRFRPSRGATMTSLEVSHANAKRTLRNATVAAAAVGGAAGAVPVPFVDVAVVAPVQIAMINAISAHYNLPEVERQASFAVSVLAAAGVAHISRRSARAATKTLGKRLAKLVAKRGAKVLGPVVGAAVSAAVATTATQALGRAWIKVCACFLRSRLVMCTPVDHGSSPWLIITLATEG